MSSVDKQAPKRMKPMVALSLSAVLLLVLFIFSFVLGRYDVPVKQVLRILLSRIFPVAKTWEDTMATAVLNIRLPRILLCCLVGSCLSLAGTSFQCVFQNPMASPDILGASSGACFGAALAILLGQNSFMITVFAFVASLATIVLTYLVSSVTRGNPVVNILLAGVMVSSLFSASTSYIKLVADPNNQLPAITYWLMGSLSGARMQTVRFMLLPVALGTVPLLLLRWRVNLLTLGDEEARTIGIHTGLLRVLVILCATILTATSVSVSGMIGWIGLVIPHLSRKMTGNDCRYLFFSSMLNGAFFLLLVDNISRNLLSTEIPIGILTAFVGAPFFIYLMTQKESYI